MWREFWGWRWEIVGFWDLGPQFYGSKKKIVSFDGNLKKSMKFISI